ncbi:hypothetical protein HOY82DRAFT_568820 [Tuber indicum]|nr:hypothetical protein HOY82DRAFT_568820 [Tuber indicum]
MEHLLAFSLCGCFRYRLLSFSFSFFPYIYFFLYEPTYLLLAHSKSIWEYGDQARHSLAGGHCCKLVPSQSPHFRIPLEWTSAGAGSMVVYLSFYFIFSSSPSSPSSSTRVPEYLHLSLPLPQKIAVTTKNQHASLPSCSHFLWV